MANRYLKQFPLTGDTGTVMVDGYCNLSNSDSTVLSHTLALASIARTNTGEYTITLQDSWPSLKSCHVTPVLPTAKDIQPTVKSFDVLTAKTIVIVFLTGTTPTDLGAGQGFFVSLCFKNSGLVTGQ